MVQLPELGVSQLLGFFLANLLYSRTMEAIVPHKPASEPRGGGQLLFGFDWS